MAGILNAEVGIPVPFPTLDQYGPNTTLLLHGDGTNGAQNNTFLDSSTNNFTITRNGNTTQGTFSPFSQPNGWWSNYFNQSGFLYNTSTSVGSFGTNNFTVEFWLFTSSAGNGSQRFIYDTRQPGIDTGTYVIYDTSNNLLFALSGTTIVSASASICPVNQWFHVAICRTGTGSNQVTMYINGNSVSTGTISTSISSNQLGVGAGTDAPLGVVPFLGYISNLRIVNGTAVYTSNFTPPTTPLTAITNTVVLTCQSNRFVDNSASPVTFTVSGAPSVQSFHPISAPTSYFPAINGGAGYFDGSGDYLNTPTNTNLSLGTNDFAVEAWVYFTTNTATQTTICGGPGTTTYDMIFGYTYNGAPSIVLYLSSTGSSWDLASGVAMSPNNNIVNSWNHIALTRSGSTFRTFFNGSQQATFTSSASIYQSANQFCIGSSQRSAGNPNYMNGYISNARIVIGSPVYTSNFTPSTTPLTAITNTQLLLSSTNAGIIDSVSQNALETVGNAQVSTTQSKFGGASMYFDGTGDWLLLNNSPIPSTGDFTVELWFWSSTATTTFQGLFGFLGNSSGYAVTVGLGTTSATGASGVFLNVATGSSSWGINANSPTGITSNSAWYHLALVRSGGTITVYVNGNAVITSTAIASTTALGGGTINRVGALANDYPLNGYIDDFRVTRGIARYTQNFTPPQNAYPNYGPLTNIPTVDPNFKNTTLLLHGNGTNGAQNNTFLDSSTNNFTITRNGNTTQGTFTPFSQPNGWWSNYFNGSSDYLSVANNAAFNLGTGDFTIEAWIYPISVNSGNANPVISQLTGASNTGWLFGISSTSLWQFSTGSSVIVRAGNVALNQWTHLAAVRISGTTTLYVNGSSVGSTSSSFNFSDTSSLLIGYQSSFVYTNCYVSNARIIKGTGAYTSNFTPPTLPLTAITNTSLLTCQSNYFKDNSTNAFTVTPSGSPSVQNFYPFFPPLDYSTAAIGGSGYFDGSGDQLNVSPTAISSVGSSDFSFECWVYATRQTNTYAQGLISYGPAGVTSTTSCISFQLTNTGYLASTYAAGDSILLTDPNLLVINQWNHCVVCRSGSTISLFKNGARVATSSTSATVGSGGDTLTIGGQWYSNDAGRQLQGYMNGIRIVKGSSAYDATQSTITVPTTPLTAITNTSLLLSCTNGGIFDNASKNDLETVGNAQISTTQSKFGGSSIYLNGSGNYLLSSSAQAYNKFGTADFTVEYWIYLNSAANQQAAVVCGAGTGAYDPLFGWVDSSALQLYLSSAASSWDIASAVTIIPATVSTGVWYHVAVTRNGSTFRTFCNGNQVSTFTSSASIYQSAGQINIGRYASGYPINAYFDDIRITNGVSRYNYNFTPPAAQFPNK